MKIKIIMSVLVLSFMIGFSACTNSNSIYDDLKKDDATIQNEIKGNYKVYRSSYEEELEGVQYTFYTYVILKDDNTGYMITQDIAPIVWSENQILTSIGKYEIKFDGDTLIVNENDMDTVYELSDEELPENILKFINEYEEKLNEE